MGEDWKVEQNPGRPDGNDGGRGRKHQERIGTVGRDPAYLGLHRWKVEAAKRYHETRCLRAEQFWCPGFSDEFPVGLRRNLFLSMPKSRAACIFHS